MEQTTRRRRCRLVASDTKIINFRSKKIGTVSSETRFGEIMPLWH